MAKRKALEVKRVGIAPLVAPLTRVALQGLSGLTGLSQGELIDDAIAGTVGAYADSPLEEGETLGRPEDVTLEMIEKAVTRVPVTIETERPTVPVGTVTVEKLPDHLTTGARVTFEPSIWGRGLEPIAEIQNETERIVNKIIPRTRAAHTWKRGPRQKGDSKR